MSESPIPVTVTREDVADVPDGAIGPGSVLVILGTAADKSRVAFRVSGQFVTEVRAGGEVTLSLEPYEILREGEE